MIKRSSSNYLLVFLLGAIFLTSCTKIQTPNDKKSDNTQTKTVEKNRTQDNQRLENLGNQLDNKYQEAAITIKDFNQEITGKSRPSQISIRSHQVNQKLEELSELINEKLFAFQLPKEIQLKLKEINFVVSDVRQKVVKPTQKGWNKRTVLEIQKNLGLVLNGEYNKNTKNQINKFLKASLTQLGYKIGDVKLSISQHPTNLPLQSALDTSRVVYENRSVSSADNSVQTQLPEGRSPNSLQNNAVTLNYIAIFLSTCSIVVSTCAFLKRNSTNNQAYRSQVTQIPVNQSVKLESAQEHFVTRTELEKLFAEWKQQMRGGELTETKYENNLPHLRTESNITEFSQKYRMSQESSDMKKLVENYNTDPGSLSNNAIEVSAREDSITQRRLGFHQAIVLEKVSRGKGNYWVLPGKDFNYLVPKKSIKINEFNYETVEALFVCNNYQSGYTHFQLCKPGKVIPISQGEMWQLSEQGQLQF